MTEVLKLTCELLKRKSVTPDDGGCLQLIVDYLGAGVKSEWLNFADTKNLFIIHGDGKAPHLNFLGHVDVVPAGDESQWTSDPFEPAHRDGKIFARGACDMKSGVAAMVVAFKNFIKAHPQHPSTVSLLITSDEEGSNINGIPKVVEEFKRRELKLDYCVVGEPSSKEKLADTIKVGRRGTLSGTIIVHGIQGHIAYPQLALNPIHCFAPILANLVAHQWDQGDEFFQPTSLQFSNIVAGTGATNVIPGILKAQFNFRFSPKHSAESLIEGFENFLKDKQINYDISWNLGGLPFLTSSGKLLESARASIVELFGYEPKSDTSGGTSDARFIAPLGTEVLELGVRGESLHKVDEFVRVEDLEPLAELYLRIAQKILA